MTRWPPLAMTLLIAACTTAPARTSGPEQEDLDAAEAPALVETIDQLSGRVGAVVERAVRAVRDELQAVRVALASVADGNRHAEVVLDELRAVTEAPEELDDFARRVDGIRSRSARVRSEIDAVVVRLEAFEAFADAILSEDEEGTAQDGYRRRTLAELETEAAELAALAEPLIRRSDGLVQEVSLLAHRLEAMRRERILAVTAEQSTPPRVEPRRAPAMVEDGRVCELTTSLGTLVLEFFPGVAPRHVANFHELVERGFYDGLTFHRIIPGYVVQAGCPLGTGEGGPGYLIENEFNDRPHRRGTLSMARMGNWDSAGSQFFICLSDRPELDGKYTVFGRVIRGDEVLDEIAERGTVSGKPIEPVIIERVALRPRRPADEETLAARTADDR